MKFKIILVLAILFSIAIVAGSIYTKKLIDELPSISNLENYTLPLRRQNQSTVQDQQPTHHKAYNVLDSVFFSW